MTTVRLAFRSLRASPWTTLMAVATLALGLGVTTAVYAAAYGILVRPLPYREPSRVALLWTRISTIDRDLQSSRSEVDEWQRRLRAFDGVAGFNGESFTLSGAGDDRVVEIGLVTDRFFGVLGVTPTVGRTIHPGDGLDEAVVSDGLRRRIEARGETVVGHRLQIGGRPFVVVGAAPPGVALPAADVEAWVQVDAVPGVTPARGWPRSGCAPSRLCPWGSFRAPAACALTVPSWR